MFNPIMELHPFTLAEAEEICEDFEDLKDTEFALQSTMYIIDDVLVCPHNSVDKEVFVDWYVHHQKTVMPLGSYAGTEFDVIVVFCTADDESEISFMDIRQFAIEKGISYSFP